MYTKKDEKSGAFNYTSIDNREELEVIIESLKINNPGNTKRMLLAEEFKVEDFFQNNKVPYLYRGVRESKFNLSTSFQVHLNTIKKVYPKMTVKSYCEQMLQLFKCNNELVNLCNKLRISFNDTAILSLMQHYGIPSPLLDWTPDIKTALNFAYSGLEDGKDTNELDDYASLYYISMYQEYEFSETSLSALGKMTTKSVEKCKSEWPQEYERIQKANPDIIINPQLQGIDNYHDKNYYSLADLFFYKFIYIPHDTNNDAAKDIYGKSIEINNPNSIWQTGAFVLNTDDRSPMEKIWNSKINQGDGIHTKNRLNCLDIKKSVLSEWISKENKIQLYPTDEDVKDLRRIVQETYYKWLFKGNFANFKLAEFLEGKDVFDSDIIRQCWEDCTNSFIR